MRTVFAREMEQGEPNHIVLDNKPVVVEKTHILGLNRTKADYILDDLKPVLKCKSFLQAYKVAVECRDNLLSKGLFKTVDVYIDTTEAYAKNLDNGIQVIFDVKERSLICGEARTELSNRDKPHWVMKIFSPNIFGRGETLSTSISHTFNSSSASPLYQPTEFSTSFSKPIMKNSSFKVVALKEKQENPWACCLEVTRGLQVGLSFPVHGNNHTVDWIGHWRELSCMNGSNSPAIDVRRHLGHSLKSAIRHTMVYDKTNNPILPQVGKYMKITDEVAGFGGDVTFIKEIFEASYHSTFLKKITLGFGFNGGLMIPFGGVVNKILINDKFFIGGPLTLRGFELNRVGNERMGTFLGSTSFWVVGAHLYAPLPFHWAKFGSGSWLDNFRMHAFLTAGNACDIKTTSSFTENCKLLLHNSRVSCGAGIAYKFMNMARIEVNFCFPLRYQPTDFICKGLQFGIGVSTV